MTRIVIENQLRVDPLGSDMDQTDSEMLLPAPVGCRTGVEQDRPVLDLHPRDVAVAVDDAADPAREAASRLAPRRCPTVAVQQGEGVRADIEGEVLGEDPAELVIIVISHHCKHGSHVAKFGEDRDRVDVARVEDEAGADPPEEFRHLLRQPPRTPPVNVRVRDHPDG